ncbi:sulfotransferase [Actinomadura meridiana]|uniref:Sulfotransferase n=1 Tax=Actinomadura meridiana TaxID=559626 RepID=A0ABP8BSQ2_9ACTN
MISRRDAPQWVKEAGRAATRAGGRLTSGARMLPDFLMVGTQRGGTTSLFRALAAHPAVVPPNFHKGVHYFDVNYPRGLGWYRGHFPVRALAGRNAGTGQDGNTARPQAFESAGYYMHHPLAPERIARDLPGVKLIVLLRDPVIRAYSAHKHELARGFETEEFERALDLEPERIAGEIEKIRADPAYVSHSHRHHSYLDRGQYADQIEHLFELFGRDRVLVRYAEDFFSEPEPCYDSILEFLGLPQWRPPSFERHNARPGSPLPDHLLRRLSEHYAPWDDKLAALLGAEPAWRRPERSTVR